jgi:hypothetical protein
MKEKHAFTFANDQGLKKFMLVHQSGKYLTQLKIALLAFL